MPKQVDLKLEIDENGNIIAHPEGTEGTECNDLMEFLKKIPGFTLIESTPDKDIQGQKTKQNVQQKMK